MNDITELVEMVLNGDRAAFDSLYEQTKSGVWFTCISLLKNEENAKDIMQDTFLAAFDKLDTLENPAAFRTWLNKIAANKCKNFITAKSNSTLASNSEEILEKVPDDKLLPEEYVTNVEKRRIIMDIIEDALSVNQFRTVILYYFDELSIAEIAELMDCHEKTVQHRLKTARIKIKEEITRYEEENNEKLHAVAPFLSLSQLFRAQAENISVPSMSVPNASSTPSNALNVPSDQAAAAVKTGGKAMLNTLKAKIIAGACAAAVVGGGVTAGVVISNNSKNKTESRPAVSAPANANLSKPANVSKPAEQSTPAASNASSNAPGTSLEVTSDGKMVEGDFEFEIYVKDNRSEPDPNYVQITKYLGSGGDVTIPSTLGGKPVKAIYHMQTTGNRNDIVSVTIPDTVTEIDTYAFRYFDGLKQINFSKNLEELGYGAFAECNGLESVVLPEGLKEISYAAFMRCKKLKSVTVPDSVEIICDSAFDKVAEDCELHYRGYVFKGDDLKGFKLDEGVLTVNGKEIAVGDLDQVLGGGTNDVGASGDTSADGAENRS